MDYITEKKLKRKLNKVAKDLNKLLIEIREHYPEANYMVEGGSIWVISESYKGDESYSEKGSIMESGKINDLDCGDWN